MSDFLDVTPHQHLQLLPAEFGSDHLAGLVVRRLRFSPPASHNRVEAAWRDMLRRYAALRVRFHHADGVPVQELRTYEELPERTLVLAVSRDGAGAGDAFAPFGPVLLDGSVHGADGAVDELVIRVHHALVDEQSLTLVLRFLAERVRNFAISFDADDSLRYRETTRAVLTAAHRSRGASAVYWRELLSQAPDVPVLGWSGTAGAAPVGPKYHHERVVDADELTSFRAGARAANVSLAMMVHAALAALLYRYGLGRRPCIGTPVSFRGDAGIDFSAVGLFVNVLPVVTEVSGDSTLRDVLARARGCLIDVQAHRHTPLAAVPHLAGVGRTVLRASDSAFFGVTLAVHAGSDIDGRLGVSIETVYPVRPGALLAIDLTDIGNGGRLVVAWQSEARPWPAADRLAEDLIHMLRQVRDAPHMPVDAVDLTPVSPSPSLAGTSLVQGDALEPVHAAVRRVCAERPAAEAVVAAGTVWRFADLAQEIGRARALVRSWLLPRGSRVGVAFGRSRWQIVFALALWEEGLCYVPIDVPGPVLRTEHILRDARVHRLLTDEPVTDLGCVVTGTSALPAGPVEPADRGADAPATLAEPAYVMYTSGSSGVPKGVVVTHGNLASFLRALASAVPAASQGRWLAETTPTFDISVLEMFWPLTLGEAVVVAGPDSEVGERGPDPHFAHRQCTPSRARQLLTARALEQPLGRWDVAPRIWLLGGEPLPAALLRELRHTYLSTTFVNMYGPTEATIWSSAYVADGDIGSEVPIGIPLDNTMLRVVDPLGRPVPDGVVGELVIAGAGVASGYLDRPDLTDRVFVRLAGEPNGALRAYRTGDLAVVGPDGLVYFRGRRDTQIKLRGHRIELAEVERALTEQPEVAEVAVVLCGHGSDAGDGEIVAAVSTRLGAEVDPTGLRRVLTDRLPDVMVPSRFLVLPALPRLPSGKTDRVQVERLCAVEGPPVARPGPDGAPAAAVLAEIASDILRREVTVADDFFALGGNSISALRLVAEARRRGIDVPVMDLLRGGPIGRLADFAVVVAETPDAAERPA